MPFAVLVALLATFLIYGAVTRIGPTNFSRGGSFGAPATPPTTPQSGRSPSETATPTEAGVPGVSASPSAEAAHETSPTSPTPVPGAALALPRRGSYAVSIDGTERVRFGPVSFCSRRFPTSSSLVIKHAAGESATSFAFDHEFSSLHKERHIYRYTRQGVFLDFEGASVNCGGFEQASENSFKPGELKVKLPLHVGDSWRGRSVGTHRTENYTAKVTRKEALTVRARAYGTFVIEYAVQMTGNEQGRRSQRWWYAPSLAMPLRWHEEIDASRMGATYSESATFQISSVPS